MRQYYAKEYYQRGLGSYEIKYDREEIKWIHLKNKFKQKLADLYLPSFLKCKKTLLDVGCGEGFGLKAFKEKRWKVKGVDFSSAGITQQNPKFKNRVLFGDIQKNIGYLRKKNSKFSCIMLINVLEHVINPSRLLHLLKTITEKKGIIIVTVPNDFSATQKLALKSGFVKKLFWVAPPEHLSYFNNISLKKIFYQTGWQYLGIYADFPVDWFLFHVGSNYINIKSAGNAAHRAKIKLETEIFKKPFRDQCCLFQAFAKIGMGRNLTGIFQNLP